MSAIEDIANRALIKIGVKRIASLTEESEPARVCNLLFGSLARAELRRHAWSFAKARTVLPATATAPAFGYATAYNLPADCLRLVYLDSLWVFSPIREVQTDPVPGFVIEGRQILIDHTGALNVQYVRDLSEDTSLWDAAFEDALVCRLALEAAPSLTKISEEKRRGIKSDYKDALVEARRSNAVELPPTEPADGSWTAARYVW